MKARGREEPSAVTQVRGSDSMHDGCRHSRSTPFAGGSELEHTRGMSLIHGNMFSGGFIYNKANLCLTSQQEMQQKAVRMKGMKAEGPRPQSLAYPTLRLVQPLLSFSSQGPSLEAWPLSGPWEHFRTGICFSKMRAQCREGEEKREISELGTKQFQPNFLTVNIATPQRKQS